MTCAKVGGRWVTCAEARGPDGWMDDVSILRATPGGTGAEMMLAQSLRASSS